MAIHPPPAVSDYYSPEEWNAFIEEAEKHQTPFTIINLDLIKKEYRLLQSKIPFVKIYYAVKASPDINVIKVLAREGACFDIASRFELDKVLSLHVSPLRISFGNTIKKAEDIKYFYDKGVRMFATDSEEDMQNIAKFAPRSKIYVRTIVDTAKTAEWPLSRKFGCDKDMAVNIMVKAKELKLKPYGISFHVGSQQKSVEAWQIALIEVADIAKRLREKGIVVSMVDLGGGLPVKYLSEVKTLDEYADGIRKYLTDSLGSQFTDFIIEPGRSMTAHAGIVVGEVIQVTQKSLSSSDKWVYLDVGKYTGLSEVEAIKYPLYCTAKGKPSKKFIIAGPTCDSADILYEHFRNPLPEGIKAGDRVFFLSAGAYVYTCSSVGFNGFPPISTYFITNKKKTPHQL